MASTQGTVDYLTDQMAKAGDIRSRKMFGEYAIYCNDKVVALVCDENLFIKITAVSDKFLDSSYGAPPYPGAKNWLKVPEEKWDDRQWLTEFVGETAKLVPLPKPKKPRAKK
jgi:TfoX/Sxy family transcriptional regulator of competence genes